MKTPESDKHQIDDRDTDRPVEFVCCHSQESYKLFLLINKVPATTYHNL